MTGFDGIRVDHGALGHGAQDLLGAARGIQARLDQLEGDLRPLATDWTGAAREAYARAKTRWDQAIADMVLLLQDAGTGVESSNAEYLAADRRGANRF
jgi:WXG100 family type VII secretion target